MFHPIENWRQRHQHPLSLVLHAVGIPMTIAGVALGAVNAMAGTSLTYPSLWVFGLFLGGYALQFFGHAVEGNDPGEVILVKRLLGRPYVPVAPRRQGRSVVSKGGSLSGRGL